MYKNKMALYDVKERFQVSMGLLEYIHQYKDDINCVSYEFTLLPLAYVVCQVHLLQRTDAYDVIFSPPFAFGHSFHEIRALSMLI